MTTERDRLNQLDYAREEGIAEGIAEGLAQGKAEGLAEGRAEGREAQRIETARKMLELKYPPAEIAAITDLTEEQIKKL